MKSLVLIMLLCLSGHAIAETVRFCELREMSMEQYKIVNNRDAYFPYADPERNEDGEEAWRYGVAAKFDVDLIRYGKYAFHWRNRVEGNSTDVQFRSTAWDFRWGLQLGDKVEIFYDHRSSHILEAAPTEPRTYELRNFYGAEITFYRRPS